jgi:thiol-disulfide isomerase/thioredoxin
VVNRRSRHRRSSKGRAIALAVVVLAIGGVIALYALSKGNGGSSSTTPLIKGEPVQDFPIAFIDGSKGNLSQFRGHTVLLWFVTTWCSSCQDGAQLLSQQYYSALHSKGVVILTVELYNNLGQPGPALNQFANTYGSGSKSDWLYGTAPRWVTYRYDPNADLDIYYLINSQGNIVDTNVGLPNYLGNIVAE